MILHLISLNSLSYQVKNRYKSMQKSIALNLKVSVICRAQQITALTAEGIAHICLFWLSARALQNNEKTMQSNSR